MEFSSDHISQLLWVAIVLGGALATTALGRLLLGLLDRRVLAPHTSSPTIGLLQKVLTSFVWVVAAILISYLFFEEDMYDLVTENLLRVVWFFVVAVATILAVSAEQLAFDRATARGADATTYRFLRYASVTATYFAGAILVALAIPGLQSVAQSALAGAGVLAVVAGLAAQEALSNIVGGLLIVVFRPFKLNDTIRVGADVEGVVEDITLRHTVIRGYENQRIVVPNAVINKEVVINHDLTDRRVCRRVDVGVAYDTDLDKAKGVVRRVCEASPSCLDPRSEAEREAGLAKVRVGVLSLGDSAVTLRAWVWVANKSAADAVGLELHEALKRAFDKEGIDIPFPQRTLHIAPGFPDRKPDRQEGRK